MRKILTVGYLMLFVLSTLSAQQEVVGKTMRGILGRKPDPPRLVVDLGVSTRAEGNVLFENESGSLNVMIANRGGLPARSVVVRFILDQGTEGLIMDSTLFVGDIAPADSVLLGHEISTTIVRRSQSVVLFVEVSDSAGSRMRQPLILHLERSAASALATGADTVRSGQRRLDEILERGRNWLLLVGINEYVHWPELQTPVRDAKGIREVLLERYGFESHYLIELYDSAATRAALIKNLEQLARVVRPEDNLLIYFAGHGVYDDVLKRGYWVPVDAELESTAGYLPNTELHVFLAAIKSRATLVISDACFSGTIFRQGRNVGGYIEKVLTLRARQALISGGNEPVMDSGVSSEHSIFAHYLLDRLRSNQKSYLPVSELFDRIKIPISNSSLQTPQCNPVAGTGDEGGEFVFVRWR